MADKKTETLLLFCFLLIAAIIKFLLLAFDRIPFNSDEAIVALMARHIVLRGELPIFFYGQTYMGSLDAVLVALGFSLFGMKVWVIRFVQIILYLGVIITTIGIAQTVFSPSNGKWFTAALLAIPTVNVTLYTTASLGGYGEALLIGNLILLAGIKIIHQLANNQRFSSAQRFGVLSGLVGLGLWANGLTMIYALPVGCGILWALWFYRGRLSSRVIILSAVGFLSGFIVGSLPWWIYAAQNGLQPLITELLGSAVAVEQYSWLKRVGVHLFTLVVLGGTVLLGMRPPWEVRWLVVPLAPFVLLFWGGVLWVWLKTIFRNPVKNIPHFILTGVMLTLAAGFVFTSFGVDPSGRYFIPVWVILALIAGEVVARLGGRLIYPFIAVGTVLIFNLTGIVQCALRFPPGLTTQFDAVTILDHRYMPDLIKFLKENGETRGYSNYWVAYPLAFLSEEEIIFTPGLPYHQDLRYTPRDDRYPAYTALVKNSSRVAYITTKNPALDDYLVKKFIGAGVSWDEKYIGDYHIYYNLSRAIHLQDDDWVFYDGK